MNPPPTPPSSPSARAGLAIASLVIGVLALLASIVAIGAVFGLVGLFLGVAHLRRKQKRNGLAWVGILLCGLSVLVGSGAGVVYFNYFKEVWEELTQPAAPEPTSTEFQKWIGVAAPDFSVTTLEGKTIRLSELKGRRVVLDFWATWCPPCVMEIPHFIKLRSETPSPDLIIVGISSEDEATLRSFVAKMGINYPIVSTDTLPAPYKDVSSIPTTFCIDRAGIIQNVLVDYHDYATLKTNALGADFVRTPQPSPR